VSLVDLADDGPLEGLTVIVDPDIVGKTGADVVEDLRNGTPSIWVREFDSGDRFGIRLLTLTEGAEEIVIDRLREILG
jgi:hypothetical protein